MDKQDGGCAFPGMWQKTHDGHSVQPQPGMSLRDYFAASIVNGLVRFPTAEQPGHVDSNLAKRAYRIADAMLAEREK